MNKSKSLMNVETCFILNLPDDMLKCIARFLCSLPDKFLLTRFKGVKKVNYSLVAFLVTCKRFVRICSEYPIKYLFNSYNCKLVDIFSTCESDRYRINYILPKISNLNSLYEFAEYYSSPIEIVLKYKGCVLSRNDYICDTLICTELIKNDYAVITLSVHCKKTMNWLGKQIDIKLREKM